MSSEGAQGGEENRRRIKLETRHGGSRESRSRRDRPCDICRTRKSACVIAVKPPCRFCEIRGLECTFTSGPRPRHRRNTESNAAGSVNGDAGKDISSPATSSNSVRGGAYSASSTSTIDYASPQAPRFPVPDYAASASSAISSLSPASDTSYQPPTRQYLSLQELTSNPEDGQSLRPVPIHRRPTIESRTKEFSVQENERARDSLEYGNNTTAHFIGVSGEQDTDLLASIRYNVINETNYIDFNIRQVCPGNPITGAPPIHFTIVNDYFPKRDEVAKQAASDAIEAHAAGHGSALIRLYFRFVHPILPILSKAGFLMAYTTDRLSLPASLRGAVYGLACAFWTEEPSLKPYPPISQPEFFEHAHAALYREMDSPKLATLQACLLVLHEQPGISGTTESPRIWALACQATACAQSLGLHQDPTEWKLPLWEKRLRKRLWWIAYINDVWTSLCHGNTPHIQEGAFDTTELTMEDLASDEHITGLPGAHLLEEIDQTFQKFNANRFLEMMKLTRILSGVLKDCCTLKAYSETIRKVRNEERRAIIMAYNDRLDHASLMLPDGLNIRSSMAGIRTNGYFHIGCFALKSIIVRQLMSPATPESKSNSDSNLSKHFDLALSVGEEFVQFAAKLFSMDMKTFWTRHSRNNLIICSNHLIYLFFCASTQEHVANAYSMLQRYQEILGAAANHADWSNIGLIRPSILRADSFFHGAADSIRSGARS
ncbi:Zn2/Cys6 DNA-binding protein [Glarea lozoyensis ATCC 20868]|uniref:Zn2/Cys6 DNA-binding protein n=1 Tax=Glarea lozoyensis (strain ATCC 20868 / MF5171) TaxID=1116229 RepID=S3DE36_GLAL2|nr:Zn2/Cys6 DNA-binding protein [Glarea lozoyensis ATCC 20868]EPE35349.1 Zn2/Cys6 DNA-binding protein [Glarea lozoyensis ATCC 20868]